MSLPRLKVLLKSWPELLIRVMQLTREGSPLSWIALTQTELSRKSNQVARARIRRFESDMPSQAVQSLRAMCGLQKYTRSHGRTDTTEIIFANGGSVDVLGTYQEVCDSLERLVEDHMECGRG